jgi:molecular chaperone DnaK (HSP70)
LNLGTTNSAVAVLNVHGVAEMIADREGEYTTPSVVFFDGETPVVGSAARHSPGLEPLSVAQFVKRHIGNSAWSFVTDCLADQPGQNRNSRRDGAQLGLLAHDDATNQEQNYVVLTRNTRVPVRRAKTSLPSSRTRHTCWRASPRVKVVIRAT